MTDLTPEQACEWLTDETQCMKLRGNRCEILACLVRGVGPHNWMPGTPVDYDKATCVAVETCNLIRRQADQIAALEKERDALREQVNALLGRGES